MSRRYRYYKLGGVLSFLIISVLLSGCHKNTETVLENFKFREVNSHEISDFVSEDGELASPQAILCVDDAIYVADKEKDCIFKYDKSGELLLTFGGTGNGEGELLSPIALATDSKQNIYVAEQGNYRVQIFNQEGKFLKKMDLTTWKKNKINDILDMEVSQNDVVYLTVQSYEHKKCRLYSLKNGKLYSLEKDVAGVLGIEEEKKNMMFFQSYKWEEGNLVSAAGYIGTIEKDKIKKLQSLPKGYMALDAVVYDNFVYAFSGGYTTLDKFSLEGEYIETIFSQESNYENAGMSYLAVDKEGVFYLSDREKGKIYRIEEKNKGNGSKISVQP